MRFVVAMFCQACVSQRFPAYKAFRIGEQHGQFTQPTKQGSGVEVREPREFYIFPVTGALFLSGLPGERPQFLLGIVPLLLDALQLRCKVLLRFSLHGPIPFT